MLVEFFNRRFQFKFKDRIAAAEILGETLKDKIRDKDEQKTAVVLGIPRGGVITADIVAKKLSTSYFDIVIPRKLADPHDREQSIGAIAENGVAYIDQQQINYKHIPSAYLEKEMAEQMHEIRRRTSLYRKGPSRDFNSFIKDRIVILVDDGAATGATIIAAVRWIKRLGNKPIRLIVAAPVAPMNAVNILKKECTPEVEVLIRPSSTFQSVEQYHRNFQSVADEEVIRIMKERNIL